MTASTSGVTATIQSRLDALAVEHRDNRWFTAESLSDSYFTKAEGEFIAFAPRDIRHLLAENTRLSARVSVLEAERAELIERAAKTVDDYIEQVLFDPKHGDDPYWVRLNVRRPGRLIRELAALTESEGKN